MNVLERYTMESISFLSFGETLKGYRMRKKITQRQLATKLGVHYNTISNWERGDFLPETKGMVLELAHHLGLNEQEILQILQSSLLSLPVYWSVPYQRNPFFTGREDLLLQLHEALAHTQRNPVVVQTYALSGLGGVGKTQVALEYAYRYFREYSAILWVNAETEASLLHSFMAIADTLQLLPGQSHGPDKRLAAVLNWLNTHRHWLLIFDNVEDIHLMKQMLPTARQGALLFTTRLPTLGTLARCRMLKPLTLEEGATLLLRRAGHLAADSSETVLPAHPLRSEYPTALAITEFVGGLPLAIDQVGAYIDRTKCSFAQFFHLLQLYPTKLLQERDSCADHPLSVVEMLIRSFNRLQRMNGAAADVLILCCFLAPDEIPETVITENVIYLKPELQKTLTHHLQWNTILQDLLALTLIRRDAQAGTLKVHPLVQVLLKEMLSEQVQREWLQRVICIVNNAFCQDQYTLPATSWLWYEQLLPHVLQSISQGEEYELFVPELSTLMLKTVTYLVQRMRYEEAEALRLRMLFVQGKMFRQEPVPSSI